MVIPASLSSNGELRRRLYSLVFVRDQVNKKILLGLKKRGFGMNKWNGLGGKCEPNESIYDCAKREATEESGLTIKMLNKIGFLVFQFESKMNETMDVHIYTCDDFEGVIKECDEMRPAWFDMNLSSIPFDSMWKDDSIWFKYMLNNQPYKGYFLFKDNENEIIDYNLELTDQLD